MKKVLMSISGRKSWNLFLDNWIVDWIELETFIKYLLNVLAMFLGLVNVIYPIIAEGT